LENTGVGLQSEYYSEEWANHLLVTMTVRSPYVLMIMPYVKLTNNNEIVMHHNMQSYSKVQ